jgi:hypothetical protein
MLLRPRGIVRRRTIVRMPALGVVRRRRTSQPDPTAGPPVAPPDPVTGPEPRPAPPGRLG